MRQADLRGRAEQLERKAYSVSQINEYVANMFDQDFLLNRVYVKGEVSNCKYNHTGHIFFSLKDEESTLPCVMFAGQKRKLSFVLEDGRQVIALGRVAVYRQSGKYQLYVQDLLQQGTGQLYERFERLKVELEEMGMFAAEYKKPLPRYSRRIGIVTAPTGAVIQDIRNISSRRNPFVQLILCPAQVQGEGAAQSIVRGIQRLDQLGVDVIIIGRGGGSMEELWAFNEEAVARAIFACGTPVISAVGHETDFTIADFVADRRASTPSEAAELAVADIRETMEKIRSYEENLRRALLQALEKKRETLERLRMRLLHMGPGQQLYEKKTRVAELGNCLEQGMERRLEQAKGRIGLYAERLDGLSPLKKLSQGYSYVTGEDGRCVFSVKQVSSGDVLKIRVSDGTIPARVQ